MKELHVSFMRDLKNVDFEGFFKNIIVTMETRQLDDPIIQKAFDRLKPHVPKFYDALKTRIRNKHSEANLKLTKTRTEYLISLRRRVKSYLFSHLPHERIAAQCIYDILKEYDKTYYVPSITTQSSFVYDLFSYMKMQESFKEAFTMLGLDGLMEAIDTISQRITKNDVQCTKDNIKRQTKREGVREAAYRDMRTFVKAIHYCYEVNLDDEEKIAQLDSLIWVVNDVIKQFRTPMRALSTKSKNRKEKQAAEAELLNSQQEDDKVEPKELDGESKTERSEVKTGSMSQSASQSTSTSSPHTPLNDTDIDNSSDEKSGDIC